MNADTLRLRLPSVTDAVSLAQEADDPRVAAGLRDVFPSPYSVDDALRWIDAALAPQERSHHWIVEVAGQLAGVTSLFPGEDSMRHNAEIGYWLGHRFWGRGLGTAAVAGTLEQAWRTPALDRVFAEVFASNAASVRILEKCGFAEEYRLVGVAEKGGRRVDVLGMGVRRQASASLG